MRPLDTAFQSAPFNCGLLSSVDEHIDHMDRVVLAYPILQTFRQERQLGSVRAFNEASHPYPPSGNGGNRTRPATFHTARVTSGNGPITRTGTLFVRELTSFAYQSAN